MDDDLGAALEILSTAGLEVTATARAQFAEYLAGNPRGKDGKVVYDLRADFDVDPNDLYDRFAFYFDAFPQIVPEVS